MAQFASMYDLHHASIIMAQYCACNGSMHAVHPQLIDVHQGSVWLNAVDQVSSIYIAQCRASGINCGIMHQYGLIASTAQRCASGISIWFNAVYQASKWLNMAQYQYSTVYHASKLWLNPVLHGSMLCIHSSLMCIRHQKYGSMLYIRH